MQTQLEQATLRYNTTGEHNTAAGFYALKANTTGDKNIAIGSYTLTANTTADYNTAVGYASNEANTTGTVNTSLGYKSLNNNTTGSNNTCIGYLAGRDITTGGSNVCLGNRAGDDQITTDGDRLFIARSNVGAGNDACWIYGNNTGVCYQGNNSSSWSTTSDRRLKKNIVNNNKGLAEINQLRVTDFEYRKEDEIDMSEFPLVDDPSKVVIGGGQEGEVQIGVIAQEIENVLPECITTSEEGAKSVNNDPIMWAMVNAIKELSAKVEELESKLNN